jgi:sugar lactone lactonase YvrE
VTTVAGSGPSGLGRGGFADGPSASARFNLPKGVAIDTDGQIFVADTDNLRIRRISKDGTVTTVAGTGELGKADGPALQASFANICGIAFGPAGNLFIADQPNNAVRRLDPSGTVTTFAKGFRFPAGVAVTAAGTVFVADTGNNQVVLLSKAGSVVARAGGSQGSNDGTGSGAQFFNPGGVATSPGHTVVTDSTTATIRSLEVSQ